MKIESLPVKLTDMERREVATMLSNRVEELKELKQENKERKKAMKDAEDKAEAMVLHLAKVHNTGEELRPVEVVDRPDIARSVVETIRCDTGEVIRKRAMSPQELFDASQSNLPGMN